MFSLSLKLAGSETEAPTAITTTKISKGGSDFPTIRVHSRGMARARATLLSPLSHLKAAHYFIQWLSRGGKEEEEATSALVIP